jgi:hypothetical protein
MSKRVFAESGPWLFSRNIDLLAFGGSAVASWLLVWIGARFDLLDDSAPAWVFLLCVVAIDVAHVWATGFRVYFVASERARRPLLYFGLPAGVYLAGVALHAVSSLAFWRVLAYVALFHFVRQQVGFLKLYERRRPIARKPDLVLDRATLYLSMLYPVVHWHAQPERSFAWFVQGDFVTQPPVLALARGLLPLIEPASYALLLGFAVRQLWLARSHAWVPGKSLLVAATASCWIGGIVLFDSDYVFTVTNVLIHGVPYFVLTHRYARAEQQDSLARRSHLVGGILFFAVCGLLALTEETLWDRLVWHEHAAYFGQTSPVADSVLVFVVPLLAVPQLTHYLLDGFVWRVRRENPVLRRELESA